MCDCHPVRGARLKKGVTRREVLEMSLAGMGLVALGPLTGRIPIASGAPAGNKVLVVINLSGGNDGLNTVVPVNLSSYYARRPTLAIPSASALAMTGGPNGTSAYRLHPSLVNLKTLWDEGSVAVVNKVGYPNENLSHFSSADIMSYAYRNSFPAGVPITGWVARYADLYAPTPMGAVSIGFGRPKDFTGGSSNPLMLGTLGQFRFNNDNQYPSDMSLRAATVQGILAGIPQGGLPSDVKDHIGAAYDLSGQVAAAITAYIANPGNAVYAIRSISNYMRDVATLIFGGFETRVFYTGTGGYDTHSDQGGVTGFHANLLTDLDNAIGSFATDMKNMGQWGNVVICVITEFGRRNYENGSLGLDHGHGMTEIVVGGGVHPGMKGVDLQNSDIAAPQEYPDYAVDFRDLYREILSDHLGANPTPVFPEAQPLNGSWDVC
jgi:uncharacterized protein (DUF1501 family)